jgi:multidrug efflux system membrane fusion protein
MIERTGENVKRAMAWTVGAVILVAMAYAWQRERGADAAVPATAAAAPIDVAVARAERREVPLVLSVVGRTEAHASVAVKSRIDGIIAEVAYHEGQPVHQGQLLVRLDDAQLQSQRRQAEAIVARDEAVLEKSRADLARAESLLTQGFVSASAVDQARSTMHADEATLRSDRAAADNVQLQTQYTRILAPIDGVAGIAQLTAGGATKANDTTLVVIDQVDPIYVTFTLPESRIAALREAMRHGRVAVEAAVSGAPAPLRGQVAFLDNAVDTTSGALTGKALVPNPERLLTPGQFASLKIELGRLPAAVAVPASAVESGVDGPYVFVVDDHDEARLRAVKVTADSDGWNVIGSGVAAGERVVLSGQEKLRDRMVVRASAAATSTAQAGTQ